MSEPKRLRWYAVCCENAKAMVKVGVGIARLPHRIPVFMPRGFRQEKQGKWMVAVDDGPLFPPYLFIAMRINGPWGAVADVEGVERIMCGKNWKGDRVPIPIPYREMRKIRTKHTAGERKKVPVRFKEGQQVRVMAGPFTSFEGIFEKPVGERVKILLSLFGRATEIEIDESDIRAA